MNRLFLILIIFTSCSIFSDSKRHKNNDNIYAVYKIGKYSFNLLIFRDSILNGKAISDEGGIVSREFFLSNWNKENDTTIVLYNILEKRRGFLPYVSKHYHIYKINKNVELLIPDQNHSYFQKYLEKDMVKMISTSPFVPDKGEKKLLEIVTEDDSVDYPWIYEKMEQDHYEILLRQFNNTLDSLGIWYKRKH